MPEPPAYRPSEPGTGPGHPTRDRRAAAAALHEIQQIEDGHARAGALAALARDLSPDQRRQALGVAAAIADEGARKEALAALAQVMSEEGAESPTRRLAQLVSQVMHSTWVERLMMLASVLIVGAAFGGLAYLCWWVWLGSVWAWGFDPISFRAPIAALGLFYLAIIPFGAAMLFPALVGFWNEYGSLRRDVESAREHQDEFERQLMADDSARLVPMLGYSRAMLNEYYAIAMSQAQRSFRYCLIAMWIGFAVLMVGVIDIVVPLGELVRLAWPDTAVAGLVQSRGPAEPNHLVLLTGVVIEFIAAAFLWVYRFTIQQQTFYYQRQLKLHNVLLAHRVSGGIASSRDLALTTIVERLLDDSVGPTSEAPDRSGIAGLLEATKSSVASS